MPNHRDLNVLDAADLVADDINQLLDRSPRRVLHVLQLRKVAGSIGGNIAEGFGRGLGADRDYKLRISRGESEEAIRYLRSNYASNRIRGSDYWRIRNRLVTIVRMLTSLLHE